MAIMPNTTGSFKRAGSWVSERPTWFRQEILGGFFEQIGVLPKLRPMDDEFVKLYGMKEPESFREKGRWWTRWFATDLKHWAAKVSRIELPVSPDRLKLRANWASEVERLLKDVHIANVLQKYKDNPRQAGRAIQMALESQIELPEPMYRGLVAFENLLDRNGKLGIRDSKMVVVDQLNPTASKKIRDGFDALTEKTGRAKENEELAVAIAKEMNKPPKPETYTAPREVEPR